MRRTYFLLTAFLLRAAMGIATVHTPQSDMQKVQFLADHPAVAKILNKPYQSKVPEYRLNHSAPTDKTQKVAPMRAAALPVLWGNVTGADSWTGRYHAYGVYSFNPVSAMTLTPLHTGEQIKWEGNGGGVLIGNRYHIIFWGMGMDNINSYHAVYDTDTWEQISYTEIKDNGGTCATDLAYDRINGKCYGAVFTDDLSGWELAEMDFSGNVPTKRVIGPLPLMVVAMGVDSKGYIYGVCEDGVLYQFDKVTAQATRIADTGLKIAGHSGVVQQSGEFDQHRDIFYWAASDVYGKCALYTINPRTAEVSFISDIPDRSRLLNIQVLAPAAPDKAPNHISDMVASFPEGTLNGKVSFTVPEDTYDGTPIVGSLTYKIGVNDQILASGTCSPGQKVSENISVECGMSHFSVWVENESGSSPTADAEFFTGVDVPVMKTIDYTADGNTSTITWSVNDSGAHGGWIGSPTYKITRLPDNVVLADALTQTTYTDVIPSDAVMAFYKYEVTPASGSFTGTPMVSNGNVVGVALQPPYEENFDNSLSFDLFTVLDSNKDGYTWQWDEQSIDNRQGVAACPSDWEFPTPFDDWLLTPEIQLEADKTYTLSFKARTTVTTTADNIEVKYGQGLDVSKYITILSETRVPISADWVEYTGKIKSTKNQVARIGFHRTSGYLNGTMKIDNIHLTAGSAQSAPAAVENIEIIPDEQGALKATIKFTAPTFDKAGNLLEGIDKIDVFVNNSVVQTYESPEPGASFECEVEVNKNGTHKFRVEACNFSGVSEAANKSVFVGIDTPATFKAWMEDNGDNVTIKWEPVTVGANGHYINPQTVTYDIYYVQNNMQKDLMAGDLTGNELVIPVNTDEGDPAFLSLGIRAKNEAGQSKRVTMDKLLLGRSHTLPYTEHFDGTSGYTYDFESDQYFDVAGTTAPDGDGYAFAWVMTKKAAATRDLKTLKLSLAGSLRPKLRFMSNVAEGGKIEVYVLTPDQQEHLVGTVTDEMDGWNPSDFDISEFRDERYVRIIFRFYKGSGSFDLSAIDDINMLDAVENDLAAEITMPDTAAKYGSHPNIKVTVTNKGTEQSGDFIVTLYADDVMLESQQGSGLNFMDSQTFDFSYSVTPKSASSIEMRAEVEHTGDMRAENNLSTGILRVAEPKVSAPENLTGVEDSGVSLKWTSPSEFFAEGVVEDFESYSPWTITNIGNWTLVDADGANVVGLSGADYPNEGVPQAYTIFNPVSINIPAENTEAIAHSDYQYLACFAADITTAEHNDDWIISPLLPGTAQTVTFYAKQMIPDFGSEHLQLLYSDKSADIKDFTLVQEYEIDNYQSWEKFTGDLPEGTKYFALRVVTRDGHICMIDDISYVEGSCTEITGWNLYKDGELFAEGLPFTQTEFIDTDGSMANIYNVTALYATGEESAFSNDATITSSVSRVFESTDSPFDIYSIDGRIIRRNVTDCKGVEPGVYIVNGTKVLISK